jgi:hypothetical protein
LPWLAFNHDSPDLCFLGSEDCRREPQAPGGFFLFFFFDYFIFIIVMLGVYFKRGSVKKEAGGINFCKISLFFLPTI